MSYDKRKRNTKTFIVVTNKSAYSKSAKYKKPTVRACAIKQRLRVGARDEKQARQLVKDYVGIGTSINAIWEVSKNDKQLPRGIVVDDIPYTLSQVWRSNV